MGEPQLEFVWVGDDAIDPLQQAQTLQILVSAGIKTREEARADLGLGDDNAGTGLGKYNQNHDEAGRFATAEDAVEVVGHPARKPRPQGVQVASTRPAAAATDANHGVQSADVIPICIATAVIISTDEFGNKISSCDYECFSGMKFRRETRGAGGCPPVRKPRF